MEQLILHLFGDYVLQSGWMADNKTKRFWPAFVHSVVYSVPFLLIGSLQAFAVILVTHYFIDRYRLARYVIWAKNFIGAKSTWKPWNQCSATGYPQELPAWLAVWLMIACDNTIHLAINFLALKYL